MLIILVSLTNLIILIKTFGNFFLMKATKRPATNSTAIAKPCTETGSVSGGLGYVCLWIAKPCTATDSVSGTLECVCLWV
jgi:hypothetical protein